MILSPTESERLTVFTAAEYARRLRGAGVRLSHPEAVALIADEMLFAARRDVGYEAIVDLASRLLTTDDVEPGVAAMVEFVAVEASFAEGTKMVIAFRPIGQGETPLEDPIEPGEIIAAEGDIELNAGRPAITLDVVNTGDRDIQVRSHAHIFEANAALEFDRAAAFGYRLDVPSGGGVRFEPGLRRTVTLVPMGGARIVRGQAGLTEGLLDDPVVRQRALEAARRLGYRGL